MDQLKPFLQACVKYRFWIAVGISVILPIVGFFLGYDAINAETLKREKEITGAKTEVGKYTGGGLVNHQYQPLAAAKKDALVQDVDATWRRLFAIQEPLLKWPAEVQDRFRKWGRKYPEGVDKVQVTSTLIDYAVVYPEFVNKIYQVFKPFNFDDGSGIVVAPEARVLLAPATFSQDNPPDLSKVWSEQERLWVVTALLDAVAKVNDSVGAKDWDGAIVKQINLLEVGAATDQDQKSIAKGVQLQPADVLAPGGAAAPPPPPASTPGAPGTPGMPGMMDLGSGGAGGKNVEVLYLKTDSPQFKALPIKLTVLVNQARLANYLVGLENSPMAIQVNEVEISKPLQPVAKPAYGERASFNLGSMGGRGGRNSDEAMMMGGGGGSAMARAMGGNNNRGPAPGSSNEMMMRMGGGGGSGGPAPSAKKGIDVRNSNAAEKRKQQQKKDAEAAKAKSDTKKIDQYYNIIEVTVYGEARFYLSPPAPPQSSTASNSPTPEPQPPAAEPAKKDEAAPAQGAEPKAETAAPKEEAPKKDEAPKDEAPKGEAPKPEAPKGEAPKPDASKGESPAPKS